MKPDLTEYLGKHIRVVVDRPMGSSHPGYPESEPYPINYGYLPETLSGDGHEIDAYLIGPESPVETGEGVVVAVVVRADDAEDKLVVVTGNEEAFTQSMIQAAIDFQERYFDSSIVMWKRM